MIPIVAKSLFPKPYCSSCFEALHKGHIGWDVCADCVIAEKMLCEIKGIPYPPEFYSELDSGKAWDACPCYHI